ncbi:MAG: MFS transporter [Betaproteobacteria bacterium]|nr:MFS transporter [Betaproteobacteria bacterium]
MSAAPDAVILTRQQAVWVFLAFAFAYFFSALVRAVTATLAPIFSAELGLDAGQLGLLGGAYFLGFALMQLPLGSALDRWGAKRVLLSFLALAVLGCLAFALSGSLRQLLLARFLIGAGVSACLMAPLTCFRRLFSSALQLRANAWMLMSGSVGMLASTLPVQWLLPVLGWRGLFMAVALLFALAGGLIAWLVPPDARVSSQPQASVGGYRQVFAHPVFVRMAPMGFFVYGGMVAMQSLWIGPWLTQVTGRSAVGAAQGLFLVNLAMLVAFLSWGLLMPRLIRAGWAGERLIALAWPANVLCLAAIVWQGPEAGPSLWTLWCVCASVVTLGQPALGQAFPAALAGRALSAFNLLIFSGVFTLQWTIGLGLDALLAMGWPVVQAYRLVFGLFMAVCTLSFLWLNVVGWLQRRFPSEAPAGG